MQSMSISIPGETHVLLVKHRRQTSIADAFFPCFILYGDEPVVVVNNIWMSGIIIC